MIVKCVGASCFNRKKDGAPMMALHCMAPMTPAANGTRLGMETQVNFVSLEHCEYIFGCSADQLKLEDLVDKDLDLGFNRRGYLDSVSVIQ